MKKRAAISIALMFLAARHCRAEIMVTSVWKRTAFTIVNKTVGPHIKVQGDRIGLTSFGYYGEGDSKYWYSDDDASTWHGGYRIGPWYVFCKGSFFLGNDGNPFAIHMNGHLYYSTDAGHTWLTNLYVPSDHSVAACVAALEPSTTNLHLFYVATNMPPAGPGTNIRYAVYAKKAAGPGWDLPATNMIVGDWPAAASMDHGAFAFRDPITGRFRSARAHALTATTPGEDPWLCVVTNNGGMVLNMNTPWPQDGNGLALAVDANGTVYMAHVATDGTSRFGTNLIFTEFRHDEGAGLSFVVTNEIIANSTNGAISSPCINLGVNEEVIVAYLADGNALDLNDVRIVARDRHRKWHAPVTVASGNSDLGMPLPGAGTPRRGNFGREWGGVFIYWNLAMDVVWDGDKNNVYLFYGEYSSSIVDDYGADTKNGVVHMLKVYDPPPPKGTRVMFR